MLRGLAAVVVYVSASSSAASSEALSPHCRAPKSGWRGDDEDAVRGQIGQRSITHCTRLRCPRQTKPLQRTVRETSSEKMPWPPPASFAPDRNPRERPLLLLLFGGFGCGAARALGAARRWRFGANSTAGAVNVGDLAHRGGDATAGLACYLSSGRGISTSTIKVVPVQQIKDIKS